MNMTKQNYKYWVTDLSDKAQDLLIKHCTRQLTAMGYCKHEVDRYVNDLANEKLGNLSELVSNNLMIKYKSM